MKHFTFFVLLLLSITTIHAQITYDRPCYGISAGLDSAICNSSCVTLNRKAIPQHENRATTSYLVQQMTMPSPAYNTTGTNIIVGTDDVWGGILPIGFNFCFFGNTYNRVVVGANGCVSFNTAYAGLYCAYSFSGNIGTTNNIFNSIMGPYTDIDPSVSGGNINWYIEGVAPCRRFVINYYRIPLFSCNSSKHTSQIILHEGYNIIDVVIINKPVCSGWNGGRAIIGIQNSTGSVNYTAPGNNPSTSAQSNICYRFLPNGALMQTINWTNSAGTIVSNTDVLSETICPNSSNTYTANLVNNRCDGTNVTVTDAATFKIDSLPVVTVNSPGICSGSSAVLTAAGANTYTWSGGLGAGNPKTTPVLIANATFTVTGTNTATGCKNTAVSNITIGPPSITVNSPTICLGGSATLTASGANNYTWSTGATSASISVNPTITTTYTVTGTITGCATASPPVTATVTVTGLPTVNDPSDQNLCLNANSTAVNFSGSAGASFDWTNDNTAIGLAASGSGNIPVFTALAAGTATITVTPKIGICSGLPQTFTISILNPNGIRLAPTGPQCSGTQLNFSSSPAGGNGTYTYGWTATNPVTTGAAINTFSYIPINATNANITPTITLNVTSNGLTCPQTFTPTIKPIPTVVNPGNQTICIGTNTVAINFNGNIATSLYSWTNNNTAIGLPASGTGDISAFTTLASGIATLSVTPSDNGCSGTPQIFSITVNPDASLTLTTANNTQTKCINNAITDIVYSIGGGGTGATVTGLPTGVTGTYAAGVFTISGTPTVSSSTPYNYTLTTTGSCIQKSLTGTITVNPDASLILTTANNTQTKCINNAITDIVYSIGGGGTGATVTGLPTGVTGTYTAGVFTISGTPTVSSSTPYNYTLTTTGSCIQKSLTGTITVNPDASLILTTANNTQTKCINNAITDIVYSIGGGGTGATVTGLPTGVTGTYAAGVFTISGTPTVSSSTPYNYTLTTTGSCIQKSLTGTITVNPDASLTLTTANNTQTKCINNAITDIVYSIGGGGTGATVTGLPTGVTGTYAAGVFTISGTPTVSSSTPYNYTLTTTGSCIQKSLTGTITVNPDASLTLTTANNTQTKCINNAITDIVYSIGGGGTGAMVTGLPTGVTGTYTAGVFTISGTPTVSSSTPYNYTLTTTGSCIQKSLTGTITVNPDASLTLTTANNTQTKCINNAITDIVYSIGGGGTGATVTGLPTGVTGTYAAGVFTISGTPTVSSSTPYNYTLTTTGSCIQKSLTGTITVNPDASLILTTANNTQTKCINNAITDIVYSIGGGGTGATVTGLPTGVTGTYAAGVFTISGTPTVSSSTPYNYTLTTTGSCIQKSLTGTITVNPDASLTLTTANNTQTKCINNAITDIVYSIGGGGTGATVTGLPTGVTGTYAAGVFTISGTPTVSSSTPYNYTLTTTGSCIQKSLTGTISVNPDASLTLTTANNTQTKCINNAITDIVYSIGGGGTGATVTGLPTGVTGTYAAGVFTISGTPTVSSSTPYNYTLTTTGSCIQKSLTGTITVNPDASLALTTANNTQTKCINNAITDIVYSIGGGGTGATVTGLPTGVTGTYAAGVFTISGTPTVSSSTPYNYTLTTTGSCIQKSLTGTITVNPDASLILTTANNTQTKCINNAITDIVYSIGGGGTGATVTGLPTGVTGTYAAGVFTISGTPTVSSSTPYNYTLTTTGSCIQKSLTGTITVNPDASLILTTANNTQTKCINNAITDIVYSIGGGGTGATVTGLPTGVTGTYAAGVFTISGTPTVSSSTPYNYTLTTTGSCIQKSLTGTITVNPDAILALTTANNTQTKCINNAITDIVYSIGGGGTGATVTGLPTGVTGTYAAGVFTISGTPTVSSSTPYNYTLTTTGSCIQKSLTGTITVNPDASLTLTTANNTQTKCINNAITDIVYSIGGGGTGATVTGLPTGVTGTYAAGVFTISGTPTVSSSTPYNYTLTTTGSCIQKSLTGTITVNPDASLILTTANNTQTKCINNAITDIVYSIGGGGTGATVTGLPTGVTGTYAAGVFTISGTPTVSSSTPYNYTLTTTGSCIQKSLTGTITVNPDASLALTTANNTQTKCINNAITDIVYSIGGGGTGATVTGLPTGVTGTYAAGVFTISGTPTVSGNFSYSVSTTGNCLQKSLSGILTINPIIVPTVSITAISNDICPGGTIKLLATPSVLSTYQWYVNTVPAGTNSNQFSSSILNNGDSIYVMITTVVACSNPNTAKSNTIYAVVNKIHYEKPTPKYCIGDTYEVNFDNMPVITTPNPDYIISWTNGSQITIDSTSQYTINNTTTTNIPFQIKYGNNCRVNDAVNVIVYPLPAINAVSDIPRAKYEDTVQLSVVTSAVLTSYNWMPSEKVSDSSISNPTAIITGPALFIVKVKDNHGCINTDSLFVDFIDECQEDFIYVPTGFSPNRDGINDCFGIVSPPKLSDFKMVVFDRWGEKLFESNDKDVCWDGTYKGVDSPTDSYPYIISYKCYNGTSLSKKGIVTIIR